MVVCHCWAIGDKLIEELAAHPDVTVDDITAQCGAGGRCGGCRDTIQWLLDEARRPEVIVGIAPTIVASGRPVVATVPSWSERRPRALPRPEGRLVSAACKVRRASSSSSTRP